jgi:protein DGCR14
MRELSVLIRPQTDVSRGAFCKSGRIEREASTDTPRHWSSTETAVAALTNGVDTGLDKADAPDTTKLSLDGFLGRYTSEDNFSFNDIVDRQNAALKERFKWLYDEGASSRLLTGPEQAALLMLTDNGTASDRLLTDGTTTESTSNQQQVAIVNSSSNQPATWKYRAKNSLMYYPEGVGSTLDADASRGAPKEITHANTRVPKNIHSDTADQRPLDQGPNAALERMQNARGRTCLLK